MTLTPPIVLLACACLVSAVGCSRSASVVAAAPVRLSVPPPPPRVISVPPEPVAPVETATVDQPEERRPVRASRPAARPGAGTRAGQASPEADPVPEEIPPPPPPALTSAPGPVLRTPQTADESEASRRVNEVLKRAKTLLAQVIPAGLSREARTQHETARRFVEQAEQALLERNFVFASYLADKAETLARGLSR